MDDQEDELDVSVNDVLISFFAAVDHTPKGGSDKEYLERRKQVALGILDWAVCESDRGRELMKAKAEAAAARKGGGNIVIGKP